MDKDVTENRKTGILTPVLKKNTDGSLPGNYRGIRNRPFNLKGGGGGGGGGYGFLFCSEFFFRTIRELEY